MQDSRKCIIRYACHITRMCACQCNADFLTFLAFLYPLIIMFTHLNTTASAKHFHVDCIHFLSHRALF